MTVLPLDAIKIGKRHRADLGISSSLPTTSLRLGPASYRRHAGRQPYRRRAPSNGFQNVLARHDSRHCCRPRKSRSANTGTPKQFTPSVR
jgi:hypothetical protein